ncbi:MAG: type II toxin-antitoxin system Phd/YefM family antitoxin [Spirochaetaceae bacterium]
MKKRLSKSKLKAHMLEVMREIEESGEELIVTDHGRPTLIISPYRERKPVDELFAAERGKLVLREDPDEPTLEEWEDA